MDKQFGGFHLFQKENVYVIHMNNGENTLNAESVTNLHKAIDAVEG
jgi:enoyl-CoA hydratase/carnithine racemase